MIFVFVTALFLAIVIALVGYHGRHWLCIRRKDCCGKGCGCLFPKSPDGP